MALSAAMLPARPQRPMVFVDCKVSTKPDWMIDTKAIMHCTFRTVRQVSLEAGPHRTADQPLTSSWSISCELSGKVYAAQEAQELEVNHTITPQTFRASIEATTVMAFPCDQIRPLRRLTGIHKLSCS